MKTFSLAQQFKVVDGIPPAADAAGRASDIVSLKNCAKAFIVLHINQGNAATILITVNQAQDVAGTGSKVLANAVPIFSNLDTVATDLMVRRTDAVNYTTDAGVKMKIVIIEIDPSALDVANGFDCISFSTGASNAANITQGLFILSGARYEQASMPSAILD